MAEITTPNTMPTIIPKAMPNVLRSYPTENNIPNKIPTQTR
jgi:hypothetical protein